MFRKSSFSGAGNCVEVELVTGGAAAVVGGLVRVRDSKKPENPWLVFTREEWESFLAGVKAGEFDYPDA